MSNINNKVFAPTQKITKAVFRGAPAIITTPDLNRQLDITEESLRELQETSFLNATGGAISYSALSQDLVTGIVEATTEITFTEITVSAMQLYYKGCLLATSNKVFADVVKSVLNKVYVSLFATKTLVTSDTDNSDHLISGAKFADGTVLPAASHWVYSNEELVLSTDLPTNNAPADKEFICTIGMIEFLPAVVGSGLYYSIAVSSFISSPSKKQASLNESILTQPVGINQFTSEPTDTDKEFPIPSDSIRKAIWKLSRSLDKVWQALITGVNPFSSLPTGDFEEPIATETTGKSIWRLSRNFTRLINNLFTQEESGSRIVLSFTLRINKADGNSATISECKGNKAVISSVVLHRTTPGSYTNNYSIEAALLKNVVSPTLIASMTSETRGIVGSTPSNSTAWISSTDVAVNNMKLSVAAGFTGSAGEEYFLIKVVVFDNGNTTNFGAIAAT